MHQFVVPQFIDVEDKIIGPITTKQFFLLMIGGFLIFVEYKFLDFTSFIFVGLFTAAFFAMFAFVKVNGMPVSYFLLNVLASIKKPKIRVWGKEMDINLSSQHIPKIAKTDNRIITKPMISQTRLQELVLTVDTGGSINPEENDNN